jgi:DNA-binding NarL/FixJ family response regulator
VITAASGRAGLDLLNNERVDAVILDYRMPEMDGEAVAQELCRSWPDLPIVMLSGFVPEIPARVQELVDVFVSKGSPPAELVAALEGVLGKVVPKKPARRSHTEVIEQSHERLRHSQALVNKNREQLRDISKKRAHE